MAVRADFTGAARRMQDLAHAPHDLWGRPTFRCKIVGDLSSRLGEGALWKQVRRVAGLPTEPKDFP